MAAIGQSIPATVNMVNAPSSVIHHFLKAQPKALGTCQIMIGLLTFIFGIVLTSDPPFAPVSVISGNVYWASTAYIATGALSVASETNLNSCVVKGSLGMNVVSAVFSGVGIGVLTGDLLLYYYCYPDSCYMFEARSKAISAVLLVFAILQFTLSITMSVFACKATCSSEPMVPAVIYANQTAPGNPQVPVVIYSNQAAPGNPQVPIVTYSNQFAPGNPKNVMCVPQVQVNMNTPAAQNLYEDLRGN